MTDYAVGDRFRHEEREQHWEIVEIHREYEVRITPASGEITDGNTETMRTPGETLKRNIEWGQLERMDPGSEEPEEGETFACPECDNEFPTERGRNSHVAQVHKGEPDQDEE